MEPEDPVVEPAEHQENMEHGASELPHRLPDTLPVPISVADVYLAAILHELRGQNQPKLEDPVVSDSETHVKEDEKKSTHKSKKK